MDLSRENLTDRLRQITELEAMLTFRIARMSKLLDVQAAEIVAPFGVNLTSYRILAVIGIFREVSAADLSRIMVFDKAQISRASGELRKKRLIDQRKDPANQRRQLLRLTSAGKEVVANIKPLMAARQTRLESLLTPETYDTFNSAMDKFSSYLRQELAYPNAFTNEDERNDSPTRRR